MGLRSQGKVHLRNCLNMQGVRVVALCDLAQAILDGTTECFTGLLADEANALVKRRYRSPYVIPQEV